MIYPLRLCTNWWTSWRKRSANRKIFGAILIIGGLTLIGKLATLAKELIVAQQFGTSDSLDAFLIAFALPMLAINVAGGSFNASLIPRFVHTREKEGRDAAQRLLSGVLGWSIGLLICLSVLLALSGPYVVPFLGSGFGSEKLALTRSIFYFLLPVLLLSGLSTIWGSILNAEERFALAAATPLVTPVVTAMALLLLGKRFGIYALVWGTLCGLLMEASLLAAGLRRQGYSFIPRWSRMDRSMKQVFRQYLPMAAGAFLMSGTILVDQAMAAMLGPGSVSVLNYGNKMSGFIIGISSFAMGTAVFPHFSRMVVLRDWDSVKHTLKIYARIILFFSVLVTLFLVIFSEPLIRLVFERGSFTRADTRQVAWVQAIYAMQLVFYMLGILFVRLISSMKGNGVLLCSAMISLPLNALLNYLLMKHMGVAGIALSTVLVYAFALPFLSLMSFRMMKRL